MTDGTATKIVPMLSVRGASQACAFYERAFGARESSRVTSPEGRVVALMEIGNAEFGVADEVPQVGNVGPETLGGTSVRISLYVADPDAMAQQAIDAGATLIFPVEDQPYGMRQGRVRDPFGHHWMVGRPIEDAGAGH
ncbi:MAG: PhnB protein [Chloroflexota bacterium]|nr:PhnB protein [Chloroflexota bacterium]